jgi:hypothetical protein
MPFFTRHPEPVEEPAPVPEPEPEPKRHGLFNRHRDPSPTPSNATNGTRYTSTTYHTSPERDAGSGGVFRRSTDAASTGSGRRSLLSRSFGHGNGATQIEMDPSIVQARERVMTAEAAERDADRALVAARASVREAREHVRKLELEAQEEARRAKIKQFHAREVSKRGKQLGRKLDDALVCHVCVQSADWYVCRPRPLSRPCIVDDSSRTKRQTIVVLYPSGNKIQHGVGNQVGVGIVPLE